MSMNFELTPDRLKCSPVRTTAIKNILILKLNHLFLRSRGSCLYMIQTSISASVDMLKIGS